MALLPVPVVTETLAAGLAARLRELGITREYLREHAERGDHLRGPLTPTRPALFCGTPAASVFLAFFCERDIERSQLEDALGGSRTEQLAAAGLLVERCPGSLVSPFHLRIVRGMYLFSDYLNGEDDAVMGAGETTAVLYGAAKPAGPVDSLLDVGCGAGTLALLLASQAGRVVGTDINPRAVAMSRLNAAMNSVANAEFRVGGFFEPVAEEKFERIVSQPPYYAGPASGPRQVFLHGGEYGDEIARRIIEEAPGHLQPGGRALIFTSWPPGRKLAPVAGCEVLQLRTGRSEPNGGRQSITVLLNAGQQSWFSTVDVPAELWGQVTAGRIDELLESHRVLENGQYDGSQFAPIRLRATSDGDTMLVSGDPESLVGYLPLPRRLWESLQDPSRAPEEDVRELVRRGLLIVRHRLR